MWNLQRVREALDRLGLALTDHGHHWSTHERAAYEDALEYLCASETPDVEVDGRIVGRLKVIDGGLTAPPPAENSPVA